MSKIFFPDTAIATVVFVDSPDRLRNAHLFVRFMTHYFDLPIVLLEVGDSQQINLPNDYYTVNHVFVQANEEGFNKNKYLNMAYEIAGKEIIVSIDIDTIPYPEDISAAIYKIASKQCEFAIPYNGQCFGLPMFDQYCRDIENIFEYDMANICGPKNGDASIGGVFVFRFNTFLQCGFENERCVGWGFEDVERYVRIQRYHTVDRGIYHIFHLEHERNFSNENLRWYNYTSQYNQEQLNKISVITESSALMAYAEELRSLHNIQPIINNNIMYSILIPYFNRCDSLAQTLQSYIKYFGDRADYEVIIVEDYKTQIDETETRKLSEVIDKYRQNISIIWLKRPSEHIHNPAPHFNQAARTAKGRFLVITGPDCYHEQDTLGGFDEILTNLGEDVYVICACRDSEGQWYQHSQFWDRGLHWCSCVRALNYWKLGGMDEEYSKGVGFEDDDFRNKILASGLQVSNQDDLLVIHQSHVRYSNTDEYNKNQAYYTQKWK